MAERAQAKRQAATAAAIAAMVAMTVPITSYWEGTKLKPYLDPTKTWTVCTGETRVPMRTYTRAECDAMLKRALATGYGPAVLKCVPQLEENIPAFSASTDAAYNAGAAAFCRSPMAAHFRARNWRAGCDAFAGWYVTSKGVPLRGLKNRRSLDQVMSERAICLKGVG